MDLIENDYHLGEHQQTSPGVNLLEQEINLYRGTITATICL